MATPRKKPAAAAEDVEKSPEREQHPALDGNPVVEVEKRTADLPEGGAGGQVFHKTFRVQLDDDPGPDHPLHHANKTRVVEEAIQRGLHPTEAPKLLGSELVDRHRRGGSTIDLRYSVAVTPAIVDHEPQESVAPSDLKRDDEDEAA